MKTGREEKNHRGAEVPSPAPGLRERKKRETRTAIANAALELFDRQGFQSTTIVQVAAAADVSPRTVSSYFPVKEELAFPDQRQTLRELRDLLSNRGSEMTALEALQAWIRESLSSWEQDAEAMQISRRVVEAEPELRAYERAVMGEIADVLRVEIARDLGREPDDLQPRMAAAATMAVFEVVGDHFKEAGATGAEQPQFDRAEVEEQVDRAIRFVAAGVRAMNAVES